MLDGSAAAAAAPVTATFAIVDIAKFIVLC